jgi:hypothetical protein
MKFEAVGNAALVGGLPRVRDGQNNRGPPERTNASHRRLHRRSGVVTALRSVPTALATVIEVETHVPVATARAGSPTFTAWSCFHINGIGLVVVIAAAAAVAAVAPAPAVAAAAVAPAAVAAVAPAAVAAAIVSAAGALVFALALFLTDVVALAGAHGTERAILKSDDAGGSGQNKAGGTS